MKWWRYAQGILLPVAVGLSLLVCVRGARAATISVGPRTDAFPEYSHTTSEPRDIYWVYCRYQGTVTFAGNETLYQVDCYVGPIRQEEWAGWQSTQFEHEQGFGVWGYNQACSLYRQLTWSGFFNTFDKAYILENDEPVLVAQGSATWAPGATL